MMLKKLFFLFFFFIICLSIIGISEAHTYETPVLYWVGYWQYDSNSSDYWDGLDTPMDFGTASFSGMVGIGTTPQTALHIATNVGSGVKLERGTLDARWWGASDGPSYFGTISNDALKFKTNNVDRMTIASGGGYGTVDVINLLTAGNLTVPDGYVGIGTIGPQQELNVVGDVNITGNLIVGGCVQYNCSGAGGCVTLGTCI